MHGILFSGGPDSTRAIKHFLEAGEDVLAIYISSNQTSGTQAEKKAVFRVYHELVKRYGKFPLYIQTVDAKILHGVEIGKQDAHLASRNFPICVALISYYYPELEALYIPWTYNEARDFRGLSPEEAHQAAINGADGRNGPGRNGWPATMNFMRDQMGMEPLPVIFDKFLGWKQEVRDALGESLWDMTWSCQRSVDETPCGKCQHCEHRASTKEGPNK